MESNKHNTQTSADQISTQQFRDLLRQQTVLREIAEKRTRQAHLDAALRRAAYLEAYMEVRGLAVPPGGDLIADAHE